MVDKIDPDQWKAYLRFHVGNAMAPYLSKSFRDADFEFRGRVLRGETTQPPRDQLVPDAINLAAGPMLAREYVRSEERRGGKGCVSTCRLGWRGNREKKKK